MIVKYGKYYVISLHYSKQNALGPLFELLTLTHEQYRYTNSLHTYLPDAHPINPVPIKFSMKIEKPIGDKELRMK